MGRQFGWLWAAFAVSTVGTWLAFDAFALVAILALHAGPSQVSALAAVGLAAAAVVAVPLGPWVERRRKRRVMVGMDLVRFAALMSVPLAYAFGRLSFGQLLVVAVVVGAADIAFKAASGACLRAIVGPDDLLRANARFESTLWTATALGPPAGGVAVSVFGPVATMVANAASFALSAAGIRAIGGDEPRPRQSAGSRLRAADLAAGWRHILGDQTLRPLFFNTVLVNALILATAPLLAVLMLGELGFAPWQYALAFGVPCAGGLVGSRLSSRLVRRSGQRVVLLRAGTLRACWSVGLALVVAGAPGLVIVMALQLGIVTCVGVFNPIFATVRLERTPPALTARTIAAWSVSSSATVAALTALWGVLAAATSPRAAIATAGALLLATPLLLPWRSRALAADERVGLDLDDPSRVEETAGDDEARSGPDAAEELTVHRGDRVGVDGVGEEDPRAHHVLQ